MPKPETKLEKIERLYGKDVGIDIKKTIKWLEGKGYPHMANSLKIVMKKENEQTN